MNERKASSRISTPWSKAKAIDLKLVQGVCLDIDETLSTHGKLTAEAYAALWALKKAGFAVVPITGRPAGWCDHIARFWPVDAIIGENGAFTFYMRQGARKKINTPGAPRDHSKRLQCLKKTILEKFPGAQMASDQAYREYDLAIDFCEDVKPWPKAQVQKLVELCKKQGAHAKVSSIHVNTWFGDYDKRRGFEYWLAQGAPGLEMSRIPRLDQWIFIGDSPNDEPLFASFIYSVGVSNLARFLADLTHPPRWITKSSSGTGFCEVAKRLISVRSALN